MALVISAITAQGTNAVRMTLTGAANAQTATLGLFGDGTASANLPASWVGNSVVAGSTVNVGTGQGLPASASAAVALLTQNTRVTVVPSSGTSTIIGVTGNTDISVTKGGAAPWQITFELVGTPAGGAAVYEVFVEYLQSVASGGAV